MSKQKRTPRERVYREIEVLDTLKKLESEGKVLRVLRPDGQVGYMPNYRLKGRESDEGFEA